jgi:DNA-binding Xre family transcriptional regulator
MEKDNVPQDEGITGGVTREVQYAINENGEYVKVMSTGWEPKNIVNDLAWEDIQEQVDIANEQILSGKASPIMYFMAKNQMDVTLLSNYIELPKWKVKRHLKIKGFKKLTQEQLEEYAKVFEISIDELLNYKPNNK